MSILEIDIEQETQQRLSRVAAKRGLPTSDLVRAAVENLLKAEEAGEGPAHSVMEFHGSGREALKSLDVEKYVREMRDEWDR